MFVLFALTSTCIFLSYKLKVAEMDKKRFPKGLSRKILLIIHEIKLLVFFFFKARNEITSSAGG